MTRALTPCMRDVVEPEHGVCAVLLRGKVVREERVAVVDDQRDRPLHVVRAEEGAHGLVAFLLVGRLAQRRHTLLLLNALRLPSSGAGRLRYVQTVDRGIRDERTYPCEMIKRPLRSHKSRLRLQFLLNMRP